MRVCVCVCVCIYIYIQTLDTHIYVYIYIYIHTHWDKYIYIYLSLPLTTSPRQVSLITDVLNKKTLIWNPLDLKIKIENFLHLGNFYH